MAISKKAVFIFILVACFLFYEMAVQISPSIITKELMQELHLNAFYLGLTSGFYYTTYTIMQIPAGMLFDRYNIRYLIVLPLLVCVLGVYVFSIANNMISASLGRLLMGGGSAFAFVGVLKVSADVFPKEYFSIFAGLTLMLATLGSMSCQVILTPFFHAIGWREGMQIITLIGFGLAILIWLFVRYKNIHAHQQTNHSQKSFYQSLISVISKKQTRRIALYACLLWAPMASFASLWGVPFLIYAYHFSNVTSAHFISLMWLGVVLGSPFLCWWSDRIHSRTVPLSLSAILGFISFAIILFGWASNTTVLIVMLLIAGAACSGQALTFVLVRETTPKEGLASAMGFNNMAVVIAGAIFQPLVGALIHWYSIRYNSTFPMTLEVSDYRFALTVILLCYFIGSLLSLFTIKETLSVTHKKFLKMMLSKVGVKI